MVLSGIMVKMGLFAVLRWLAPVLPDGTYLWGDTVSLLCLTGMIYASLIAIKQDDVKRLIAYSSIAHIGLMCLAIFASDKSGIQGVMLQMFSHGVNIIGLWIVANAIETKYGTRVNCLNWAAWHKMILRWPSCWLLSPWQILPCL